MPTPKSTTQSTTKSTTKSTPRKSATQSTTTRTTRKSATQSAAKSTTRKSAPKSTTRKSAHDATIANVVGTITTRRMARPRGWNRDALVALFVAEWQSLPVYDAAALSAESRARGNARGWRVPSECFTPGKSVDQSACNSLRAYVRDVVLAAMTLAGCQSVPTIDAVATMLEERDGSACVVIYRRA